MKKRLMLLALLMAASVAVGAQAKSKHKPSAAVHKTAQASSTSTAAAKSMPADRPARDTSTSSSVAPADEKLPSSGPLYPDEKGPLPAPVPKAAARITGSTPSDLPAGTAIRMKLQTPLSSRSNHEGDAFSGRVTGPVVVRGATVIPIGASISGRLLRVSDPRRIAGTGSLRMLPESVMLPNGQSYAISASVVDTSTPNQFSVDEEGRVKAKGINGGDKTGMIAGTGAGAIAGTVLAGGKGMLFGSIIVGGATVIHWLTKRHPVDVPAGTELILEISHPMTVRSTALQAGE